MFLGQMLHGQMLHGKMSLGQWCPVKGGTRHQPLQFG